MRQVKIGLLLAGALLPFQAARAQDAADAPPADPAAPTAAPGEIIVTAERRSERLRDVPISITALNSDALAKAGVTNTTDLGRVTPGLQFVMNGGFLQPVIRGISSAGSGLGDSSNVAFYVDGIYQPSQTGQLMELPDVGQVEVLKGPQGTLYGQNAAGGAILINSVKPAFDLGGKLVAGYGNYNDRMVQGYVTGPLGPKLALLVSGGLERRDGYRHDILRGGRSRGLQSDLIRGRLLFEANDELSITLGGHYSLRRDTAGFAGEPYSGPNASTPLGYALATAYGVDLVKATDPKDTATNVSPLSRLRSYGGDLKVELDTDSLNVTAVAAYGNVNTYVIADIDYTAANIGDVDLPISQHDWLQELDVHTKSEGPLNLSFGLFHMNNTEAYTPQLFFQRYADGAPTTYPDLPDPVGTFGYYAVSKKESLAAYAELELRLSQALTLTAGGRYSYETQVTSLANYPSTDLVQDPRGQFAFRRFTPRVTARFAATPAINFYATYSQGFKSGFVNPSDTVNPPVKPEVVTAYEAGMKARIGGFLSLDLAAFHYKYKDLQVFVYVPPNGFYQNAAAARINGFEANASADITPDFNITAGISVLDGKYTSYPEAGVYVPAPPPAPGYPSFGNVVTSVDASGNRLVRTPKFTATVSANYGVETGAGRFGIFASMFYNSGLTYTPDERLQQPHYLTLDGELSFAPKAVPGLRLVAYGHNLTDKAYIASLLSTQFVDGVSYSPPRTYGVRAEYKF